VKKKGFVLCHLPYKGITLSDRTQLLSRIDQAGVVTRDSFIEWMASREDLDIAADLRQIFDLIDTDNSGKLSAEELIQIVRCFNTAATNAEIEAPSKRQI
jgi:Ca2+-binding EF-hand superfamily protein